MNRFYGLITVVLVLASCSEPVQEESATENSPRPEDKRVRENTLLSDRDTITGINLLYFSQDMLYAIRAEEDYAPYIDTLASLNEAYMVEQLNTEPKKKAFWLNVYNGLVQYQLEEDSATYRNDMKSFFRSKRLTLCARLLSLDDIEHGILRGKGLEGELEAFASSIMLDTLDARVHFTLNCGGGSCPPIAFYKPGHIDNQLEEACDVYLKAESHYDEATNTVYTSAILDWYSEDFGGPEGVLALLEEKGIFPAGSKPKLAFKEFDWGLKSRKF